MTERDRMDPYAVLGVTRDATGAEITRAYRRLVRAHHPDTRPAEDGAELAAVTAAYAILRDPRRRVAHDRRHPAADNGEQAPPRTGGAAGPGQPYLRAGPVRWHRTH